VTLPGAAGGVTAVDCEAGSAVAGGAVTLPGAAGDGSCGDDVTLPGTAGEVTAVDWEAPARPAGGGRAAVT
jgi:hypothetical protein